MTLLGDDDIVHVDWAERREDIIVLLDHAEHRLVMTVLEDDVIIHVDWAEHRLVMKNLGNDVIVHLDPGKHRLVMIDLDEDVVVHVDSAEHRLVMTDLGDDVIIHVGWAEHSLGHYWPWRRRHRPRGLRRTLSGHQWPRRWRQSPRGSRRWEHIVSGRVINRINIIDLHIKRRNSIGWRMLQVLPWWFLFVTRYNIS